MIAHNPETEGRGPTRLYLHEWLLYKRMTRKFVCEAAGLSPSTLRTLEKPDRRKSLHPQKYTRDALSLVFGVPFAHLMAPPPPESEG
jgi:transcriptional regulator with XRE-family HTH domain